MTSRKTYWALAGAFMLMATVALGQQAAGDHGNGSGASDQNAQSRQQGDRAGGSDQSAQGGGQVDDQIHQVLTQIAQDPNTAADKLFLLTAALHTQSEIELARQVAQKTQNPQVKKMAQNMLQQLQKTHEQIQQTAQAVGLQLPQELNRAAVQAVRIVATLPADQLDRQYTAQAQADNAQDTSQYQSEAQIAQDPQVKRFAHEQAQGMQQRSQDANQTARGLGMQGGGEAQPAGGSIPARDSDR